MVGTGDAHDAATECPWAVPVTAVDMAVMEKVLTTSNDKARDLQLVHVLLLHRHGDRTPVFADVGTNWKIDPSEYEFWGSQVASKTDIARVASIARVVGRDPSQLPTIMPPAPVETQAMGQLTQLGLESMQTKGTKLRARYAEFIKSNGLEEHPTDQVFVESSFLDRTIQSTECLLDGMFPVLENQNNDEDSASQTVFFVRTTPDNMLAPQHEWEIYDRMELFLKEEMDSLPPDQIARINALREQLRQIVGVPAPVPLPWIAIGDVLICRKSHGIPFPDGITDDMFNRIRDIATFLWFSLYTRKQVCRSSFLNGVREVYDHLRHIVYPQDGDSDKRGHPKLTVFSAHDNSIVALLCALRIVHGYEFPVYGTVLAFEVYQDQRHPTEYFLRVLYEDHAVPFVGHEHDIFVPFCLFEARAQEFLQKD